jgi:hypothetical protein
MRDAHASNAKTRVSTVDVYDRYTESDLVYFKNIAVWPDVSVR